MTTQKPLILNSGLVSEMSAGDAITASASTIISVLNQTGATITKGQAVYISGANGDNPTVSLASSSAESTSSKTLGLAYADIANGNIGTVVTNGLFIGIDTSTATAGQSVWLSSTPGGLVFGAQPTQPLHGVFIGKVARVQQNNGSIFVAVQNGYEISELHDVLITSPANNNLLSYDSTTSLWKNVSAINGVSVGATTPSTGAFTTLSASSTVSGTGFSTYLASPPAIGGTTPAAITGTTITANTGFVGAHNGTVGATTPNTGAFTTLSASGQLTLTNASNYNIYASGAGANYFAGKVGIGANVVAGTNLTIANNITGSVNGRGAWLSAAIQSDVTTNAFGFATNLSTNASAFTLGAIIHMYASQSTIGAGSSVTNQYGFFSEATLTGATNNYGFLSNIAAATGRYNFYAAGTADNYFAGSVGIGGAPYAGVNIYANKAITGSTISANFVSTGTIQSDVTNRSDSFISYTGTQAASFTLGNLRHFGAYQATIGAGSSVTSQHGFFVDAGLTGATNNYGFYSSIAAPTSGISTTGTITSISSSGTTVTVNHNAITYTNGQTVTISATANATSLVSGVTCTILTAGTTDFTLIGAANNNVGTSFTATGAGTGTGTVTLNVQGSGKTVAGAASGSFTYTTSTSQTFAAVTVLSGSVTVSTRYNFYAGGTAQNLFSGDVLVFGAGGLGYGTGSGGSVTQATSRTTGVTLNKTNGAITLVSAAGSAAYQSFTVTNSTVAATDTIIVNQKSGTDLYEVFITAVAAGSFRITFATTGGTTTEQPVFNFSVIKASAS